MIRNDSNFILKNYTYEDISIDACHYSIHNLNELPL